MSEPVHTVILCEDVQLRCFIRRFLLKRGWSARQIYEVSIPARGGGVSWVLKAFPDALLAFRSRNAIAETCLVVGIDADHETIEERISCFKRVCEEKSLPFRSGDERIAFVIPKRNIETWLAWLRGESANETDVYRKYRYESECSPQVARLDQMCAQGRLSPPPAPPSLAYACQEFKRLRVPR